MASSQFFSCAILWLRAAPSLLPCAMVPLQLSRKCAISTTVPLQLLSKRRHYSTVSPSGIFSNGPDQVSSQNINNPRGNMSELRLQY